MAENGNGVKPGIRTSEFGLSAIIGGVISVGDRLIQIPDNIASEPGLMTTIIVAKYVCITVLAIAYIYARMRIKEACSLANGKVV